MFWFRCGESEQIVGEVGGFYTEDKSVSRQNPKVGEAVFDEVGESS